MTFAWWGDLHIGRLSRMLGEEVGLKLHRRLIQRLITATREVGAQRVAILGDIFDSPFPSQDEMLLILEALSVKDIKFLVYTGNHDTHTADVNSFKLLSKLPEAGALTNVVFSTKPKVIKWAGMKILILPYGNHVPKDFDGDLILFHNSVVGASRDNSTIIGQGEGYNPLVFRDIMAVGGHLHTPQRLGNIHFVGTQGQYSFGEGSEKKFYWMKDGKMYSKPFIPPWILKTVSWDSNNPPNCEEPNTYYRLKIGEDRPGPSWVAQHPQVIKTIGGSKTKRQVAASKIVKIMDRPLEENDEELLQRWLIQYSNLDKLTRTQALRIHRRISIQQ